MNNQLYLLIGLFVAHFLADFTHLSNMWMLNAKRLGTPLYPIYIHSCIHGLLTTIVLYLFTTNFNPYLILLDIFSHFVIDVWKGKMNSLFPSLLDNTNKWHWIVFGFDQLLHAITKISIYYLAIQNV